MSAGATVLKISLAHLARRARRGRTQVHAFIGDDLYKRLKAYSGRRGLADAAVIEEAIKQHLDQSTDAALIMRRLDRSGRRIDKIRSDVEMLTEFMSLWVRLWFAHTPRVADAQKGAAQADAAKRYEQFLAFVTKRLSSPQRLVLELLGEEPTADLPEPESSR
jgi:predicted DNA-binding protein